MSIVSLASTESAWRGYEYWRDKKVVCFTKNSDESYSGVVSGSDGKQYQVMIDLAHPRKSSCTCPHAAGRQIICKHKVALYFSVFPDEAEEYFRQWKDEWDDIEDVEEEDEWDEREFRVLQRIQHMRRDELQQALCQLLFDGPAWQFDQFIEEYVGL